MSKHTPGPWSFWADRNMRLQVGPSPNYTVAKMMVTPIEGQQANASLLAAAPELLDALVQMVSVFLDTEGRHGESENDAMDAARAAIAKATGEEA